MWRSEDSEIEKAKDDVLDLFNKYKDNVFYSRQVEVLLEDKYFHWITNAALRSLYEDDIIKGQTSETDSNLVKLYWHKANRYPKRQQKYIIDAVNYFSNPDFNRAIGNHGETLISDALFRGGFIFQASESNQFNNKKWTKSDHNLDFIVSKDNISYGIEVKNTLGYMDKKEMDIKIDICLHLGLVPIFACRMLPKNWISEVVEVGGFAWIMKYQLYPFNEKDRAQEYKKQLMLPVDSPKRIYDGTIDRLLNFHNNMLKN